MIEFHKTAVVTDSSCDLSDEQLRENGIRMLPLRIVDEGREYRDRLEMSEDELYAALQARPVKTNLPSPDDLSKIYDQLAEEGYTEAVHLSISSGLSGTCAMARLVASTHKLKVKLVDSRTLSGGLGLIALAAAKIVNMGGNAEEAAEKAELVRKNQMGMFVIRTLEYLRRGGRIGLVEGTLGELLQIKPIIHINDDGVYQTIAKGHGYKHAVEKMIREAERRFSRARVNLFVVHGRAQEEAVRLMDRLKSVLNVVDAYIRPVSPVLAVHTGPGLLGLIANLADD